MSRPRIIRNEILAQKPFNNGDDAVVKTLERLQNIPTLKRPALAERYGKGELVLLLRVRTLLGISREFLAVFYEDRQAASAHSESKTEAVLTSNPSEVHGAPNECPGDDERHLMFIYDAGLVEKPKIVSPRLVRFELSDDLERSLHRGLFYSCQTGFQFVGILREGEIRTLASVTSARSRVGSLPPQNVESRSEIVDGIAWMAPQMASMAGADGLRCHL